MQSEEFSASLLTFLMRFWTQLCQQCLDQVLNEAKMFSLYTHEMPLGRQMGGTVSLPQLALLADMQVSALLRLNSCSVWFQLCFLLLTDCRGMPIQMYMVHLARPVYAFLVPLCTSSIFGKPTNV